MLIKTLHGCIINTLLHDKGEQNMGEMNNREKKITANPKNDENEKGEREQWRKQKGRLI